ncbi:MAG: hypothetical protein R3344_01625, partial [Acidobacteriota bacterium]|nr:hypothetical protein [Acidobacteriota bacterium]
AALGGEWDEKVYPNQLEAVRRICEDLAGDGGTHVYLRVHPNLRMIAERDYVQGLHALEGRYANLTVIHAGSSVCSYAMLDRSDTVLSFGGTVGLEAIFWGKPSIVLSNCYYKHLGGSYNPGTHEEVMRLIREELSPKDRIAALKMAYYRMRCGFKQPYYDADRSKGSRRGYTFKGDRIAVRGLTRLKYKIAKRRSERRFGSWRPPSTMFGRQS